MIGYLKRDTTLRTGPGEQFKSRGLVGENGRIEILDNTSEWHWVRVRITTQGNYNGLVGWMYKDNIDRDK